MSLTIETAALRIRRQIRDAEQKTDAALIAQSNLLSEMIGARTAFGAQPSIGQAAVIRLASAQQNLVSSQNNLLRTHDALIEIYKEVGLANEEGMTEPSGLDDLQVGENLAA